MPRNAWILISLLAGLALACTCDARAWDYVATRETTITSERPIAVLAMEAIVGVIDAEMRTLREAGGSILVRADLDAIRVQSVFTIDGKPVARLGILPSLRRLVGFVLWDQAGTIERTTTATVRGHSVRVTDTVTNGRVWVRVVIGPPLGDKRVKCAVLTLEAIEDGSVHVRGRHNGTTIILSCSAHLDLPGDRCHLVRRAAKRAAERQAGPELSSRVRQLEATGKSAVKQGRAQIPAIVMKFLDTVTSQER